MKTTIDIDDQLLLRASELTGTSNKAALVKMGLETLIRRRSAVRLTALGGTEKKLKPIRRRRGR